MKALNFIKVPIQYLESDIKTGIVAGYIKYITDFKLGSYFTNIPLYKKDQIKEALQYLNDDGVVNEQFVLLNEDIYTTNYEKIYIPTLYLYGSSHGIVLSMLLNSTIPIKRSNFVRKVSSYINYRTIYRALDRFIQDKIVFINDNILILTPNIKEKINEEFKQNYPNEHKKLFRRADLETFKLVGKIKKEHKKIMKDKNLTAKTLFTHYRLLSFEQQTENNTAPTKKEYGLLKGLIKFCKENKTDPIEYMQNCFNNWEFLKSQLTWDNGKTKLQTYPNLFEICVCRKDFIKLLKKKQQPKIKGGKLEWT